MRLGFTGSQQGMTEHQKALLMERLLYPRPSVFVHGGCIGADDEADVMAAGLGIYRVIYPSTHLRKRVPDAVLRSRGPCVIHMARPPLQRNPLIVAACERLLAAPAQAREVLRSGTWTTVREGRRRLGGLCVHVLPPQ